MKKKNPQNKPLQLIPKKTPNSQSSFEKEKQNWRYHNHRFQDTLQSYSNQNSKVLAQK